MDNPSTSMPREHPENTFRGIVGKASSASTKKGHWDVFINHRGCDVKHKLASTIYHTLDLLGLRAFLDENELHLGDSIPDEIQDAMRSAQLHIAIFSERYAESPWCLAELAFMVQSGAKILPVFYHVKSDDLRWVAQDKGCYASAFSQHEVKGRYSSAMLNDWKSALQKVSYLSGYILDSHNDDEGKLLKSIVNSVLGAMKKVPLEVAKHPVAMDEIVQDFERSRRKCIKSQSEQHVQIVGILGFGGSGKTTLATELYNRKCSSFNRSCFLHDVRDAAFKNALHAKQKRLLEDLCIQNVKSFDNYKEGKAIVADRLKSVCVLLVLDDVDHDDQVDALLPPLENLGSGSMIIVTTREGRVLTKCGISSIYTMQPLQHLHAKQLFCWNAFLQPFPQEGFHELVELFLGACSGLPLSLKVIGGQLYGRKSTDYWYAQLNKIRKALPEDIKAILKVSFDALDPDEQNVFLDVACFFIGEKTRLAIHVWDGSGWSALCSLETLLNKCLVEVDKEGLMRMHDHLRDLGRDIATTRSPSRFWFERQSVVHIQRGMLIRGIMAATPWNDWRQTYNRVDFTPPLREYMDMMRNSNIRDGLQILGVAENDFTQECGELSRGLLWLRWFDFQHRNIPSWLSMENIRVLDFFRPLNLEALWDDARPPRSNIEHLKHLKRLSLVHAEGLLGLPEEFCRLQSLEHLVLQRCCKLSSLPNRFGDLLNLRHLDLSGCSNLKMLPESFKQLIRLEYLYLSYCEELTLESDILENMANLKVFDVSFCRKLETLPHNITNQASLTILNLLRTRGLRELPTSIGRLRKLEELQILGLPLLTRLPISSGNLSSLVTLTLEHCPQLCEMPSLGGLVSLVTLKIIRCPQLYEMPSLAGLVSLVTLMLEDCPQLYEMPSLAGLISLQNLHVMNCHKLEKIEGLEHLTSLEYLALVTNWISPGILSLPGAERLRWVNLRAENISAFEACIQSIQMEKHSRWQMILCGRIFPAAHSILDSFTFPGLVADEHFKENCYLSLKRSLKMSHAAILCLPIDREDDLPFEGIWGRESMSGGEWMVILVITEDSDFMRDVILEDTPSYGECDGWLVVGEMGSVIEGFKQLFQTLCKASSIS